MAKISDYLDYEQPTKYIVENDMYSDEYNVPVLTAGKSFLLGYTNETDGVFPKEKLPVIIFDDFTTSVKYVDFPFKVKSSAIKILKPTNQNVNIKYFYYLLDNLKINNSLHKRYWISDVSNRDIDDISIEEQNKCVEEIDNIVNAIKNRENVVKQLEEYNSALYYKLLNNSKCKLMLINECCNLKSGSTLSASIENEGGNVTYIKVGDMNLPGNEKYITTSTKHVSLSTAGKGVFPIGSVLFPKRGAAIYTNKKRMTVKKTCADLNIMGVYSKDTNVLLPEFLYYYFYTLDLKELSNGAAIPQLNNKDIAPLEIQIPSIELQRDFAKKVNLVDKMIDINKEEINDLSNLLKITIRENFKEV